jgi:hypothetical protein
MTRLVASHKALSILGFALISLSNAWIQRSFRSNAVILPSSFDEYADFDEEPPEDMDMNNLMQELFDREWYRKEPKSVLKDPMMGYTRSELESLLQERATNKTNSLSLNASRSSVVDEKKDSDAIFLEPEDYVNAYKYLNPDGSLRFLQDPNAESRIRLMQRVLSSDFAPKSPDFYKYRDCNYTMEDVIARNEQIKNTPFCPIKAQELHDLVFKDEQDFLSQSQIFRESLSDPSKADEARLARRGGSFEKRQEEALRDLDKSLAEWELVLASNYTAGRPLCDRCTCLLSKLEIRHNQGKKEKVCQICYGEELVSKYPVPSEYDRRPARTRMPMTQSSILFRRQRRLAVARDGEPPEAGTIHTSNNQRTSVGSSSSGSTSSGGVEENTSTKQSADTSRDIPTAKVSSSKQSTVASRNNFANANSGTVVDDTSKKQLMRLRKEELQLASKLLVGTLDDRGWTKAEYADRLLDGGFDVQTVKDELAKK